MSFDLTVIICATKMHDAYEVCKSIQETSCIKCQFFIHDNNFFNWSLAKTYNFYARQAKAESILFCHQDVKFAGIGWGKKILKKLSEKDTGTIGYAGSVIKLKDCYSGWALNLELSRNNYCYKTLNRYAHNSKSKHFDEVAVIDGLAMFSSKKNALKHPFDEKNLTGFHCYDIDFSMQLFLAGFKNYVFVDRRFTVIHDSGGKYDKNWAIETKKITDRKWNKLLPIQTEFVDQNTINELRKKKQIEFNTIMYAGHNSKIELNKYSVNFNSCENYSHWQ